MALLGDIVARMRMDNRDFIAKSRGTRNELGQIDRTSQNLGLSLRNADLQSVALAGSLGLVSQSSATAAGSLMILQRVMSAVALNSGKELVRTARMTGRELDIMSRVANQLPDRFFATQRSAARLGGTLKTVGLSLGIIGAAGYAAYKTVDIFATSANDLTRSLTKAAAIQELTGDQFARMRAEALRLARDPAIKDFAPQLGEGYFYLASAGQTAEQQIASLETVATFATAGNFDLARATDLATDAQSALGMTSKDATENLANLTTVTDTLVRANTLANASVEQFSTALTNDAGATARAVGEDIADVTAVLAAFADQGTKDAAAGTQYAVVMRDLQTKAIQNADAFRAAGIAVFDAGGEFRDFADIVSDIEQRLDGLSDSASKKALLDLGFSDKSVKSLQTLLGTSEKIRGYEAALRAAGGTAERVAAKSMTALDKAAKRSTAAWQEFRDVIGAPLEGSGAALSDLWAAVGENATRAAKAMQEWSGLRTPEPAVRTTITLRPVAEPGMPRRAADVEAERAAERVRKLNELINTRPKYTIDLTDAEKVGATADETAASLRELHNRLWLVRKALESGTISQEKYAAATANLYERLDQATGGARAYVRELARELDLLGMVEEQKKRAAMDEAGASMDDLDAVAAWQAELRFRRERLDLERQLLDLRKPGTTTFREREAAGLTLDQIIELQRLEKAVSDTTKAAAIKDALTTPRERITEELTEALRLFRRGKLDAETWQRQLAKSREEWAALNDEVSEHTNLVSSAADAYSAEAWTRIFNAAQPTGGKPGAAPAVPGAMTGPAGNPASPSVAGPARRSKMDAIFMGISKGEIGADSPDLVPASQHSVDEILGVLSSRRQEYEAAQDQFGREKHAKDGVTYTPIGRHQRALEFLIDNPKATGDELAASLRDDLWQRDIPKLSDREKDVLGLETGQFAWDESGSRPVLQATRVEPRSVAPRATPPGNGDAATQDRVPQQQLGELQQLRRLVGDLLTANNRTTTAIEQLQTTIESDE